MTVPHSEPTKLVEVPVSLVPQIEQFVKQGGVGCPYYESTVPGGFPSPAQDESYSFLNIVSLLIPHPERTFLVRMPDDSLIDEGIFRDDILIAEEEEFPRDGELAVCKSEGEIFLTRLNLSQPREEENPLEIFAVVRYRIHTLYGPGFF